MKRNTIISVVMVLSILASMVISFASCNKDTTPPSILFLSKDGKTIDRKGDTTIMMYTKYVDPGCYVEDNASLLENIEVTSDIETVLPIEKKDANHMGEVKKSGEYKVTYTATDEAGNVGTRSKTIKCRNISEFYAGKYSTHRDRDAANLNLAISNDTLYYSTISAANNVAGRLRFPKVACHTYNGQTVSFKVDADLYSPEFSPSSASAQIGYLGTAADKEVPVYKGLSYEDAVDSVRYKYTYLQISAQNYVYSDSDQAINDYNVDIKGHKENGRPTSKIVYDERGTMLRIELELEISLNNNVFNGVYREIYMLE